MCEKHAALLAKLIAIQKEAKRERNRLNRIAGPGKNATLKALNEEIRWRTCALWQIQWKSNACGWCRCEKIGAEIRTDSFTFERLAISTGDNRACLEVVGSSPAHGSNS